MRIQEIEINDFKVFHKLKLTFNKNCTILFGVNGVGKSTVLAAINYIFRVFLNQINPAQTKAFERFNDDMINIGAHELQLNATVKLDDYYLLARRYKASKRNSRETELTYPKVNYQAFREKFKELYLSSDDVGMPVFVYYGTNRTVLDFPDRIRGKHDFDKLSAIEHAIDLQLDFRTFFEWFREKEADEVLKIKESPMMNYTDKSLACVRTAVEAMIGEVKGLQIKRNPVRMVVDKADKEIRVDMLSDGEKCTLALLGDLARRLAMANPSAENPLEGKGIVMIDEIELHMHPLWQRRILHVLRRIFPNIQFIITTHSPQVLGEANDEFNIVSLQLDNGGNGIALTDIDRMNGYDSNMILEEYMETSSQSEVKKSLVKSINEEIRTGNYTSAKEELDKLKKLAGEDDQEYILSIGYLQRRLMSDIHQQKK